LLRAAAWEPMKPKYYQAGQNSHGQRDRWMISYMDVLTILLILFVAAAAHTAKNVPPSAAAQPSASKSEQQSDPRHAQLMAAQRELEQRGIDARMETRGVVIRLPQAIVFAPGDDHVSAAALPVVDEIGGVLAGMPNQVTLAGYADATPIHNRRFTNNWQLAAARGFSLLNLLTSRSGIAEERLSVASYGTRDPREPNATAEGRALNRRAEIVILE
jgi:chemotaxis protein MotB